MNKDHLFDDDDGEEEGGFLGDGDVWTDEELRREEAEIRDLDKMKRELQERLRDLDKDLVGVLR